MKTISLNRNQLKYLVIAAMLIDHIAWAFVPTESPVGQIMHFIGRLTGPTMAYFLAEGYQHTRNVGKYAARLGIFALLSWMPFCFFEFGVLPITIENGKPFVYPAFGVIYTLFLALLALWLYDRGRCPKWCKVLGIIGLCLLSAFGDWPAFDVLYALFFFCYRNEPRKKWTAFSIITILSFIPQMIPAFLIGAPFRVLFQLGIFTVPFLIQFCYNGESGSRYPIHKWFFYIFYPAHLLLLGMLKWL